MTEQRAQSYTAVIRLVDDGELSDAERERIRTAADTLVFARSWDEPEVRTAVRDMRRLADVLLERWPAFDVEALADGLEGAGPALETLALHA